MLVPVLMTLHLATAAVAAAEPGTLAPPRAFPNCTRSFVSYSAPVDESFERFLAAHPDVIDFANAHPAGLSFLSELRRRQANARAAAENDFAARPRAHLTALAGYVGAQSRGLNRHLRTPGPLAALNFVGKFRTSRLTKALDGLPDYEGVVFRGLSPRSDALFAAYTTEGQVVTDPGFTSTSDTVSNNYAPNRYGPRDLYLIIRSRTGKSLNGFGHHYEREVLFRPGTRFRVMMVMPRPNKAPFVFLDEVTS